MTGLLEVYQWMREAELGAGLSLYRLRLPKKEFFTSSSRVKFYRWILVLWEGLASGRLFHSVQLSPYERIEFHYYKMVSVLCCSWSSYPSPHTGWRCSFHWEHIPAKSYCILADHIAYIKVRAYNAQVALYKHSNHYGFHSSYAAGV